jgi:hypothetical protein
MRRTRCTVSAAVSIGLLLAAAATSAHAGSEIYLNGGLAISRLGDDAEVFGTTFADNLGDQVGGTWTSDSQNRTGAQGGIGFRYTKSGMVGLAVEVDYATRGNKYKFVDASGSLPDLTGTWKLNYVEVPVLLWVSPTGPETTRPFLMAGPVVTFKKSADFVVEGQGQSQSVDVGQAFKSTGFGGLFGVGVRLKVTTRSTFDLETRFLLGLTNVLDSSVADFHSSGFSILAGWSWALGNQTSP